MLASGSGAGFWRVPSLQAFFVEIAGGFISLLRIEYEWVWYIKIQHKVRVPETSYLTCSPMLWQDVWPLANPIIRSLTTGTTACCTKVVLRGWPLPWLFYAGSGWRSGSLVSVLDSDTSAARVAGAEGTRGGQLWTAKMIVGSNF